MTPKQVVALARELCNRYCDTDWAELNAFERAGWIKEAEDILDSIGVDYDSD